MNESWQDTIVRISRPVRYAAASALGILALFLLVATLDALANFGTPDSPYMNTITVEGTGEATAVPDIASIGFSVTETAVTVAEAQTKATTKTDAALAFLKGAGIEDKDVKTTGYNVYPQYESVAPCYYGDCGVRNPLIIGYQVTQSVEVKVRDTAKAGGVLQGLGNVGVQNIYGPNFTVDDEDAARNEAREKAIAEAREKAKTLANQLGVRLGKVVSFYENNYGYPVYDSYGGKGGAMEAAQSAPSLPTGENETTVSVSITYEIK